MNKIVKKTLDGIEDYLQNENFITIEDRLEVQRLCHFLLNDGKCDDILDAYDFLDSIFDDYCHLNLEEKGFIFSRLQNHNVLWLEKTNFTYPPVRLQDVKMYFSLSSWYEAKKLYDMYYYHKASLSTKTLKIFQAISLANQAKQVHLRRYIQLHKAFVAKQVHDEEDYSIKNNMLVIGVPEPLVEAFVAYYKSLDSKYTNEKKSVAKAIPVQQKEEKALPSVSRTSLKKSLSEMSQKDFSYRNYEDLLKVLKGLNYPDEKNHEILKSVFETAQKDPYYYNYILKKAIFENGNDENLNDILFLLYNADHSDIEECIEILDFIRTICDESFQDIMKKDEYDLVRMRVLKN